MAIKQKPLSINKNAQTLGKLGGRPSKKPLSIAKELNNGIRPQHAK